MTIEILLGVASLALLAVQAFWIAGLRERIIGAETELERINNAIKLALIHIGEDASLADLRIKALADATGVTFTGYLSYDPFEAYAVYSVVYRG